MARTFPLKIHGNKKPEAEFKRQAIAWLHTRFKGRCWHLNIAGGPYQRAGSPDSVFSIQGRCVFIEWKSEKGRLGPRQKEIIEEIRMAGGRAYVVSTWEELWHSVADIPAVLDVPLPAVQMKLGGRP